MNRRRGRLGRQLALSIQLFAAHRLRTLLSVSGLLVGVATVMVMVAVGQGAEQRVVERVRAMGTNLLIVSAAPAARISGRQRQVLTSTSLRPADAAAIVDESPFAQAAAPAVTRSLIVRLDGRNSNVTVVGTTPTGLRIRNMSAEIGRVFDESEQRERRRVALLGPTAARNLFGSADAIGREIRIGAVPVEVIGVMRARGTDAGGTDLDNVIAVPLETAMRRVLNVVYVDALFVRATTSERLEALETDVSAILVRRHPNRSGVASQWTIQNQSVLLRTERAASRTMNRLILGVAALALCVGGVGIAAVMFISVRERAREIGLRRAVGARRADIQLQFVLESAMLAAAGGLAGVMVGLLASGAASLVGSWEIMVSWRAAALGVVCSTVLGIVVGALPASRAARLEPIEALRAR